MESAAKYLFSVDPSERDVFGDAAAILSADPTDLDNVLTLSIASVPAGKHKTKSADRRAPKPRSTAPHRHRPARR